MDIERAVILTINGERLTVQDWSERSGTPVPTIQRRHERGASDYDAVFAPVDSAVSERMRELGRAGGTARAAVLPRERRREIAKHANRRLNGEPALITALGFTGTPSEWEQRCGLSARVITARVSEGWSDLDAVTVPLGAKRDG